MNSLVKQGYDKNLVQLGFYPAVLSGDHKKLRVADIENDRELEFELENYKFKVVNACAFKTAPKEIKEVVEKDEKIWFDDLKVAYPVEEEKPINRDPFLLGVKDKKYYFICSWESDVWEAI